MGAAIEKECEMGIMDMSTVTEAGVMDVKTKACEVLLQHRVELKYKTKKVETIMNRLTVATPEPRDNKVRPAFIPPAALQKKREKQERKLEEDEEDSETVHDGLDLLGFVLQLHPVLQQHLAGLRLDVHHTGLSDGAHVHYLHLALLLDGVQHGPH